MTFFATSNVEYLFSASNNIWLDDFQYVAKPAYQDGKLNNIKHFKSHLAYVQDIVSPSFYIVKAPLPYNRTSISQVPTHKCVI